MSNSSEASLYERLGGYDAIATITDEFRDRLMNDPKIVHYWASECLDKKRRDRQLIVDFLCEAAGGPTFYTGREMQTSHTGLGITDAEYDILMEHCIGTLEKLEVAGAEKADVCAFVNSLRDEIVEKQ